MLVILFFLFLTPAFAQNGCYPCSTAITDSNGNPYYCPHLNGACATPNINNNNVYASDSTGNTINCYITRTFPTMQVLDSLWVW